MSPSAAQLLNGKNDHDMEDNHGIYRNDFSMSEQLNGSPKPSRPTHPIWLLRGNVWLDSTVKWLSSGWGLA
jgi:hypothetical protein